MKEQKLVYVSVYGHDVKELPMKEHLEKGWKIVSFQCASDGYKEGGFVIVLLEREIRHTASPSPSEPVIAPLF